MLRFSIVGDIAGFTLTGRIARWEADGTVWAALDPVTGPPIIVDRAALKAWTLELPSPVYPASWTGARTVAADFRNATSP